MVLRMQALASHDIPALQEKVAALEAAAEEAGEKAEEAVADDTDAQRAHRVRHSRMRAISQGPLASLQHSVPQPVHGNGGMHTQRIYCPGIERLSSCSQLSKRVLQPQPPWLPCACCSPVLRVCSG